MGKVENGTAVGKDKVISTDVILYNNSDGKPLWGFKQGNDIFLVWQIFNQGECHEAIVTIT